MSYALDFAPEAREAWRTLEVSLQEAVLDELDRLADRPLELPRGASVRDVIRDIGGSRHYVFLQVHPDHARQTLHVYVVGHYARPVGPAGTGPANAE